MGFHFDLGQFSFEPIAYIGSLPVDLSPTRQLLFIFLSAREYVPRFATVGSPAAILAPWLVLTFFFAFGAWRLVRVPQ
jgi:hypothetical protein